MSILVSRRVESVLGPWDLVWAGCDCAEGCPSRFALLCPADRDQWLPCAVGDVEEGEEPLDLIEAEMMQAVGFMEGAELLVEAIGWPFRHLDATLLTAMFAFAVHMEPRRSRELDEWGPDGVRSLRKMTGPSVTAFMEAVDRLAEYRANDGGRRLPRGDV